MLLPVSLSACGKGGLSGVCTDDAVASIKQIVSFRLVFILSSVRDLSLIPSSQLLRGRLDTIFSHLRDRFVSPAVCKLFEN